MSYRSDGDPRVAKVEVTIYKLVEALKATGDPMFNEVNPAAIRWLNEALAPLGYEVILQPKRSA